MMYSERTSLKLDMQPPANPVEGDVPMNHHEQILSKLQEDLVLRGLARRTQQSYVWCVRNFLTFCNRPVEQLEATDIRHFLLYLIQVKKLATKTINLHNAAIRFLFAVTLGRTLNYLQVPRMKIQKKLPVLLSRQEVFSLFEHCPNLKHKAMLMVIYSAGLRVSEAAALKVHHIDSKAMRVFVACGKGAKDRYTLLSEDCLIDLRKYWRAYRPRHPEAWLFLGKSNLTHIASQSIREAFDKACQRAGITKQVSIHSLRHAFATHLLEDGATLLQVKALLGHANIQSTTIYLHLANLTAGLKSPLDNWPVVPRMEDVTRG